MTGLLNKKEKMMTENWNMLESPEQMMKHCSPDQMMDCLEMLQSPDKMKKRWEKLQSKKKLALKQVDRLKGAYYWKACETYTLTEDRIKFWEKIWKAPSEWEQRLLNCLVGNIYWRARLNRIDQSPETKVYYRHQTDYPPNRVIDIITQASTVVIIVAYDLQGRSWDVLKVAKALTKKETHKGKKRGAGREGSISRGQDGEVIRYINWECIPFRHIQKIGRPQIGFYVSQDIDRDCDPALHSKSWGGGERAKGGAGRDRSIGRDRDGEAGCDPALHIKSWGGGEREKGGAGRDESIGRDRDREAIPNIDRDCDPALHSKRPYISQANGRAERQGESSDGLKGESGNKSTCRGRDQERSGSCGSECRDRGEGSGSGESQEGCGFGSECGEVKGEESRSVESECRDAEGEESRSGASQDRDGEGKGSSSGESQGQDIEVGSASGERQGRDRNAEGGRSKGDEDRDQPEPTGGGGLEVEQERQESNQEETNFSAIPETFICIICAIIIAAVDFHYNGFISSRILGLLVAINLVGFLCCLTSMLLRRKNQKKPAVRIFGTVGTAAAGLGLLLLVSVPFSSSYRWMILGIGSLAILVISVLALRN